MKRSRGFWEWGLPDYYGDSDDYDEFSDDDSECFTNKKVKHPTKKEAKPVDNTLIRNKIADALSKSEGNSEFVTSGVLSQAPQTVISVKNTTDADAETILKFPVYENEVDGFILKFHLSPYGLGEKTLVDTGFRNSFQLNPDSFEIQNQEWETHINETLVPMIAKELNVSSPFSAKLYKLLLYRKGGFFKPHRDSEKEDGMFGTLVVQLPSKYTGGQLVVQHDGKSKTVDFSTKDEDTQANQFKTFYSALYCDCEHEVLPLTDGIRVCLIYNLVLTPSQEKKKKIVVPKAPCTSSKESSLLALLEDWKTFFTEDGKRTKNSDDDNSDETNRKVSKKPPLKLVYILSHQYSTANLKFENLKSDDKALATMLKSLAKDAGIVVLLGMLEKETSGDENGYGNFDSSDEECYAENMYDIKTLTLLSADSDLESLFEKASIKKLGTDPHEIIPENRLREMKPYDDSREETGNEGVKVTLQYKNAAIIIFPKGWLLKILGGNRCSLGIVEKLFLEKFNQMHSSKDEEEAQKLKAEAMKAAEVLVLEEVHYNKTNFHELLNAMVELNDASLISKFLKSYKSAASLEYAEVLPLLIKFADKLGWTFVITESSKILDAMSDHFANLTCLLEIFGGDSKCIMNEDVKHWLSERFSKLLDAVKKGRTSDHYYGYSYSSPTLYWNFNEMKKVEFLNAVCKFAKKIDFNPSEFLKAMTFSVVIQCLSKQVSDQPPDNEDKKLEEPISSVAKYFFNEKNISQSEFCSQTEQQKMTLLSDIYYVAKKIDFDASALLMILSGTLSSTVLVNFLVNRVAEHNKLDESFVKVAEHHMSKMKEICDKVLVEPDWRIRKDFQNCGPECQDCYKVRPFMYREQVTDTFKIPKTRQGHVIGKLVRMGAIRFECKKIGTSYSLEITKERSQKHQQEVANQKVTQELYSKLKSLLDKEKVSHETVPPVASSSALKQEEMEVA